ncbi:type II secretion system protein [Lacticaseibacillus absianus]|uniref:type II secretion system protein n=1 Tax=Lacticaseibacillus absianus TaxID=2729623 RepID=UPI0015C9FAB9|nr:type II secretion system protein [Lacticaseibacillus absianus]
MRRAFTLLELIVVLALVALAGVLGVRWSAVQQARQAETQFFANFEAHWATLRVEAAAARQYGVVKFTATAVAFRVGPTGPTRLIAVPATVVVPINDGIVLPQVDFEAPDDRYFGAPQTLTFRRPPRPDKVYTVQLGWGVLKPL